MKKKYYVCKSATTASCILKKMLYDVVDTHHRNEHLRNFFSRFIHKIFVFYCNKNTWKLIENEYFA